MKVFDDLKVRRSSTPVLRFMDFIKPFEVHINASEITIDKVLMQDRHPIAFKNKKLCGAHLRWPTHEKELYVIACA